jgi:hypothetical protein
MNTARLAQGEAGVAPTLAAAGTALAGTAVAPAANAALSATSVAPPQPARTVAPAPAKRGKGPWLLIAGAVVVVAAAAVALISRGRAPEPAAVAKPPVKIEMPAPVAEKPPVLTVDASPVAAAPEAQPKADKRDDKMPVKTARGKAASREEALSPTLLADLEAGARARAAKDAAEAIRLARHSLYEKKTARASAILTRAFCLQHDLGAAKAELGHVAASERARVLRACRAAGMEL